MLQAVALGKHSMAAVMAATRTARRPGLPPRLGGRWRWPGSAQVQAVRIVQFEGDGTEFEDAGPDGGKARAVAFRTRRRQLAPGGPPAFSQLGAKRGGRGPPGAGSTPWRPGSA